MDRMMFRSYLFEHNPASISVKEGRRTATHFRPGVGDYLQVLGPRGRTVTCKGAFFAESYPIAAAQLERFRAASADSVTGMLFIPGFAPFAACLTDLAVEAHGDGRIIPYTMVFTEVLP